jgi:cob(I)alamin adenosyltransferase
MYHRAWGITVRRMKIYTKTGDKGTSSLFTGERRPKNDAVFEALGSTDELSSYLGLAREHCDLAGNELSAKLNSVQCALQDIGSSVATPDKPGAAEWKVQKTRFDPEGLRVQELERWIDDMEEKLTPLKTFILPVCLCKWP